MTFLLKSTEDGAKLNSKSSVDFASQNLVMFGRYESWNFNFGNTPLDWIQELLE